MTTSELNSRYGLKGRLAFHEETNGLVMVTMTSAHSVCKLSLYGAQILSFIPNGAQDLLMVSNHSLFEKGKPIRGGIPLCFPWFNIHPVNPQLPGHGFARITDWEVANTGFDANGAVKITLGLMSNPQTLALWPFPFSSILEVLVGQELEVKWLVKNSGPEPIEVTSALHTYFNIGDVNRIRIDGLEEADYVDSVRQGALTRHENRSIVINQEVNRLYLDTTNTCQIIDPSLNRTLVVRKTGSNSTIVWNPWMERSLMISDLGDEDYHHFVCVETGNVNRNALKIKPGESHVTTLNLSCK
jgi:glucose-6-phosphate 1-epimerase